MMCDIEATNVEQVIQVCTCMAFSYPYQYKSLKYRKYKGKQYISSTSSSKDS